MFRRGARYEPLLERVRGASVDVVNERWRTGKGAKKWAKVLEKRNAIDGAAEVGSVSKLPPSLDPSFVAEDAP